jgi:hypothetical protein
MKKLREWAMAVVLLVCGPALILIAPFIVLSSPVFRRFVYDEGWGKVVPSGCFWISELNESVALKLMGALMVLGTAAVLFGVFLSRSERSRRFDRLT